LKSNRVYTIIWTAALVFSTAANVAGNAASLAENPGRSILDVFVQSAVNMTMMSGIFSMILGGMVISREEDEKTIEFLLGHPLNRLEIALSKFAAFAVLVGIFNLVLLAADFALLEIFKTSAGYDRGAFLGVWASELLLIYFFGAAGLFYSSFVIKGGGVVGTGIGVPVITGILAALGNVDSQLLRLLSYLSPYRYLNTTAIIARGGAQPVFVIVFLAISVSLVVATFGLYSRRQFAV
jgi:ABC-2 type transport system permease protein